MVASIRIRSVNQPPTKFGFNYLSVFVFLTFYSQKSCIDFAINARPIETYIPPKRKKYKYKIWKMVVSTPFDYFIMLLIVLNTLLLMMKVNCIHLIFYTMNEMFMVSPMLLRYLICVAIQSRYRNSFV